MRAYAGGNVSVWGSIRYPNGNVDTYEQRGIIVTAILW